MIHLALPYLLVAMLAGLGAYGILARRHAVLVLVGVELLLGAAGLLLVTVGQTRGTDPYASAEVLTLLVITVAAAEVVVALAVLLALYRARGHVDLQAAWDDADPDADGAESDGAADPDADGDLTDAARQPVADGLGAP